MRLRKTKPLTEEDVRRIVREETGRKPVEVTLMLGSRELSRVVTREVLHRAARGPSTLVGGSLVTGASLPD